MNEPMDPLEAELKALKPHGPTPQLRQQIANRLSAAAPIPSGWRSFAKQPRVRQLAACAIAAGLAGCAIIAFLLRTGDRSTIARPTGDAFRPTIAAAFDKAAPSVWAYQRALSRSPAEFEALLDMHAAQGFQQSDQAPPPDKLAPAHLFIGSDRNLLLQGEL